MDEGIYLTEFISRAMHRRMVNKTAPVKPLNPFYNSKILLSERAKEVLMLIC